MNEIRENFLKDTKEYLMGSYKKETYTIDQNKSLCIVEEDIKRKKFMKIYADL